MRAKTIARPMLQLYKAGLFILVAGVCLSGSLEAQVYDCNMNVLTFHHSAHDYNQVACRHIANPHFSLNVMGEGGGGWEAGQTCESNTGCCKSCYACCNGKLDEEVDCACSGLLQNTCETMARRDRDVCRGACVNQHDGFTNTENDCGGISPETRFPVNIDFYCYACGNKQSC